MIQPYLSTYLCLLQEKRNKNKHHPQLAVSKRQLQRAEPQRPPPPRWSVMQAYIAKHLYKDTYVFRQGGRAKVIFRYVHN